MLNEGNQIDKYIILYLVPGSDFLTSYGSGSASLKITVPVPQHCKNEGKLML
jgi:hypothetical protein